MASLRRRGESIRTSSIAIDGRGSKCFSEIPYLHGVTVEHFPILGKLWPQRDFILKWVGGGRQCIGSTDERDQLINHGFCHII